MTSTIPYLISQFLNWRSLVDIVIIAAGVLFVYRTFFRLGTWKIAHGILLALVLFLVANFFDLTAIRWIYSNLSQVAIIALIIIFQPEIRKLFERAATFRSQKAMAKSGDLASLLAEVLFSLARSSRGALIVLPGRESLGEKLSGGVALDALPTVPLILSLFDPHSPGHDGAVILEKGRLSRYGVRLPVSTSGRLDPDFGTRHHAALGLAEESDALILVVSEERAAVSAFHNGTMAPVADEKKLRSLVEAFWREMNDHLSHLSLRQNRKALSLEVPASLLLAMVFWTTLTFSQSEIREETFTVPVVFTTPKHLVLTGEKPSEVKIHVAGQVSDLNTIQPAQLSVKINLSEAQPGKQTVVITENDIRPPRRIRVLDAKPSTFDVTLVEIVEKDVKVKPQLVGKLPGGLRLLSIQVEPEQIRVLSPANPGKDRETSVMTTPIYLDNIRENTRLFCKITAPPHLQPPDRRWPDVEVRILVSPPAAPAEPAGLPPGNG